MINPLGHEANCRPPYRWVFAAGVLALVISWGLCAHQWGALTVWKALGVPAMDPNFADARVITAGAESSARGLDPLTNNLADPWHRPMNYPRIWQALFISGMDQDNTTLLAAIFIGFFFLGLIMLMEATGRIAVALQLTCILSPGVLLALERGNNDLMIFFLISCAVIVIQHRPWLSAVMIWFSFVLKLYPIVALGALIDIEYKRRRRLILAASLGAVVYFFIKHSEIHTVLAETATANRTIWTFGSDLIIWLVLLPFGGGAGLSGPSSLVGPGIAVFVILVTAKIARRKPHLNPAEVNPIHLAAFRIGTAIFILSFTMQVSFCYRLVFLLLAVPQLSVWVRSCFPPIKIAASISIATTLITLWASNLPTFLGHLGIPNGSLIGFLFAQLGAWILLASLTFINVATLPSDWLITFWPFGQPHALKPETQSNSTSPAS